MSDRRFRSVPFVLGAVGLILAVACSTPAAAPAPASPSPTTGGANTLVRPTAAAGGLVSVLPNSDLAVGPNRFLIGLIDDRQQLVTEGDVSLRFFTLNGDQATLQAKAPTKLIRSGDKSLYAAQITFSQPGTWGVEATLTRGEETLSTRPRFEVKDQSQTPAIGQPAPKSKTKTATDPAEVATMCTAQPVDDMHALSIDEAVSSGKPSVILFGTPAYCTSQTCGPALEEVQKVQEIYRDRVNFVHVEIYEELKPGPFVAAVTEWNLPSDPWVFVIDRDGKVSAKFETMISAEELEPAVAQVVSS